MVSPLNRSWWPVHPLTRTRPFGFQKSGFKGDHRSVYNYTGKGVATCTPIYIPMVNPGAYFSVDALNEPPLYTLDSTPDLSARCPRAVNRSWSKLVSKIRDNPAQLGVAVAEWRQGLNMVATRSLGLYHAFRSFRRGNISTGLMELGLTPKRIRTVLKKNGHRQVYHGMDSKHAADLWLEYSFGWSPLCSDVYDALTAIEKPIPVGHYRGVGREDEHLVINDMWTKRDYWVKYKTVQGARVRVVNPNMYLAQTLGLANPATIAWELVPFSFLVDWAFDVGSWLGGFTDLMGLDIEDSYTSTLASWQGDHLFKDYSSAAGKYFWTQPIRRTGHKFQRKVGLTRPVVNTHVFANVGTSWKRAANAVSLLVQLLHKG